MSTTAVKHQERCVAITFAIEWLLEREDQSSNIDGFDLRMKNVLRLGNAAYCREATDAVVHSLISRARSYRLGVEDPYVEDVIKYLKAVKASDQGKKMGDKELWVFDNFSYELQLLIDLANAAGYDQEVEWITTYWSGFHPLVPGASSA